MKKLIKVSIIIFVAFFSYQVMACPHVDKYGRSHFQFYNDDYTIMTMMYPRESHVYSKDVELDGSGVIKDDDQDHVLNEKISFPIIQNINDYKQTYYFIDERLQAEDWYDKQIKTNIEGIENLEVVGETFTIKAGLSNSYFDGITYDGEDVTQVNYNILVDILNEDESITTYNELIKKTELELALPNIISIDANYEITENTQFGPKTTAVNLNQFKDPTEFYLNSSEQFENEVVLIKLDELSEDTQKVGYQNSAYHFSLKKPGVYAVVYKASVKANIANFSDTGADRDFFSNNLILIFTSIAALFIIGLGMIFKIKKND